MAANIGKPCAGKTGTTDDYKDAWFVGYTPSVVTGVWVGNDDNSKMGGLTGGTVPAIIWKNVMAQATEPYGNEDFGYPDILLKEKGRPVSQLTDSKAPTKYYDDSDVNAPTEDVVQVNSYVPSSMNERAMNPSGVQRTVSPATQPPIPTAGQDFNN
jgi:penicillin-binding protein 1A